MSTILPDDRSLCRPLDKTFVHDRSPFGELLWFEELPSTSDHALHLAGQGQQSPPFVVWATRQTAGRGQGANRWWTSDGALTFSVAVATETYGLAASELPKVALASAVAICRVVEQSLPSTRGRMGIKWPNDVWCDGRKLAGILVEAVPEFVGAGTSSAVVIGIGLNVNNRWCDVVAACRTASGSDWVPPTVPGTSLWELSGRQESLEHSLASLLVELDVAWRQLAGGDPQLIGEWQRRSVLDGRGIRVVHGQTTHTGRCLGIAADGTLRLTNSDSDDCESSERRLVAGRVEFLPAGPPLASGDSAASGW